MWRRTRVTSINTKTVTKKLMPLTSPNTTDPAFEEKVKLVTEAVDLYHTNLVRYAFKLTNQWQDAENIVQELWKYIITYVQTEKIQHLPLLRRKTYQLFIDHYRAAKRKPATPTDNLPEKPIFKTAEAYTDTEELHLRVAFFERFPEIELNENQKNALWLHARYGFTFKEIEQMTGTSSSTIGDWIALGRKRIAEQLSQGDK